MKKIFKYLSQGLLILLLLFSLIPLLPLLPIKNSFQLLTVLSGSMEPALPTGSLILVRPQPDYIIGDIITWKPSDSESSITHRIISQDETGSFLTQGDANNTADPEPAKKEQIIGRVLFHLPWLGYPIAQIQNSRWLFALIILPALILIIEEINQIRQELKKKKDYANRVAKREENKLQAIEIQNNEEKHKEK
jgi:signal peptidase